MRRQLSKKKRALYTRRIVFLLGIFVVAMIQNTPHLFPTVLGARAFLLLPLVCCMAMFEQDLAAGLLGAFAGVIWDFTVASGDGYNAFILMIFAASISLLITYLMRNHLTTAMILGAIAILLYVILHWFFFVIASGAEGGFVTLFTFYLPSAIYTFIFVPIFYIVLRSFMRRIKE